MLSGGCGLVQRFECLRFLLRFYDCDLFACHFPCRDGIDHACARHDNREGVFGKILATLEGHVVKASRNTFDGIKLVRRGKATEWAIAQANCNFDDVVGLACGDRSNDASPAYFSKASDNGVADKLARFNAFWQRVVKYGILPDGQGHWRIAQNVQRVRERTVLPRSLTELNHAV